MLEEVRGSLLSEARLSPQLLSDLAGLESYVAESYDSRSFIELLQNADDAGASNFLVKKIHSHLIVANNGRSFSRRDFEAICRSASSTKQRGNSIGYRGIGFKSVVSLANNVHIISGDLEVTFSRWLTEKEIPQASKVPLIRIPHSLDVSVLSATKSEIGELKASGYTTFFIFSDLLAESIDGEFANFDPASMLFLQNIELIYLQGKKVDQFGISKNKIDEVYSSVQLSSSFGVSGWLLGRQDQVLVAFCQDLNTGKVQALPEKSAVVHAFLPTYESTGLGVKVNGDISTDPSRTRVVFDQRTSDGIFDIARLISNIIKSILGGEPLVDAQGMLSALLPLDDPRLYKFQRKTFRSELLQAIQAECLSFAQGYSLRPAWLNSIDFCFLSRSIGIKSVPEVVSNTLGASGFMNYIGAKESGMQEVMPSLHSAQITPSGCVEVVAELVRLSDTKQINTRDIDTSWPVFISDGKNISIDQAKNEMLTIDVDFVDSVGEKVTGPSGLRRLISSVSSVDTCSKIIPVEIPPVSLSLPPVSSGQTFPLQRIISPQVKSLSLKKWRGAEEQLGKIFSVQGWDVLDVSRQNIGYDLECKDADGNKIFIEVKLIESSTQPFTLTSNEEAVSRVKGESYIVALVKQAGDILEVSYIADPSRNLELVRQCRQWVWECSSYPYNPSIYKLE